MSVRCRRSDMCWCIFFFKQKTAYEMRISDWSSDVCSSDLLVETVVGLTPSMGGPQRLAERAGSGRARELVMTGDLYDAATLHSWEIGRASCRERVCQYV